MKRLKILFFLVLCLIIPNVYALEIENDTYTMASNSEEEIELYVNANQKINGVRFSIVYGNYDVIGVFKCSDEFTCSGTGTTRVVEFDEAKSGKIKIGTINIKTSENPTNTVGSIRLYNATDLDRKITLDSQTINVTIDDKKEDSNFLKQIDSKIVNIKLEENVFDYIVNVKSYVKKLDLKPVAIDDSYSIDISSQKIDELENNTIVITVSKKGQTQTYNIKVNREEEQETTTVKKENTKDKIDYSYKKKWLAFTLIFLCLFTFGLLLQLKKKVWR